MRMRNRLADAAADAYQFAGRQDSPVFVLDFFHTLCRLLDPVKVPPDCINPAMVRGLSRSLGIPLGLFIELLLPPPLEFLADSPEQIAESIDRTGLRGKLEQAVQAAIARARGTRRESSAPTINRTGELDPEEDVSS